MLNGATSELLLQTVLLKRDTRERGLSRFGVCTQSQNESPALILLLGDSYPEAASSQTHIYASLALNV